MHFYKVHSIKCAVLCVVAGLGSAAGFHHDIAILSHSAFVVSAIAFFMSADSLGKYDAEKGVH